VPCSTYLPPTSFSRQGFNDQCLGCVATHLRLANFARGELIYEHGQRGDEMFLIIEGAVVVHANDRIATADGKKLPDFMDRHAALSMAAEGGDKREEAIGERIAAKGDVFGEGGLFPKELGLIRRESATALTWVSTYALSAAAMQDIQTEYPEVGAFALESCTFKSSDRKLGMGSWYRTSVKRSQ
jgi:CRP-like cAMP-binding protein